MIRAKFAFDDAIEINNRQDLPSSVQQKKKPPHGHTAVQKRKKKKQEKKESKIFHVVGFFSSGELFSGLSAKIDSCSSMLADFEVT